MNGVGSTMLKLAELPPGQSAVIVRVDDANGASTLRRLGFNEGVSVQVLTTGSPVLVRVETANVAVNRSLLALVDVCRL